MDQFSDFTYMKDIDLGNKANMSYRLRVLLNECIDLNQYGEAVQSISFSPMIGSVLTPESNYIPYKKKLILEFYMEPKQAISVSEATFFQQMLDGFLMSMKEMDLPKGFDFIRFEQDLKRLRFDQVPVVV